MCFTDQPCLSATLYSYIMVLTLQFYHKKAIKNDLSLSYSAVPLIRPPLGPTQSGLLIVMWSKYQDQNLSLNPKPLHTGTISTLMTDFTYRRKN